MRKDKKMKSIEDIKKQAKELGYRYCKLEKSNGHMLSDKYNRGIDIVINNIGNFIVYKAFSDKKIATGKDEQLDNEVWYKEILDLLYEPIKTENEIDSYELGKKELDTLFNALVFARDMDGREENGDFDIEILDMLIEKFSK